MQSTETMLETKIVRASGFIQAGGRKDSSARCVIKLSAFWMNWKRACYCHQINWTIMETLGFYPLEVCVCVFFPPWNFETNLHFGSFWSRISSCDRLPRLTNLLSWSRNNPHLLSRQGYKLRKKRVGCLGWLLVLRCVTIWLKWMVFFGSAHTIGFVTECSLHGQKWLEFVFIIDVFH